MDTGGLLSQFDRYARSAYIAGAKLTVEDISFFIREFLTKKTFAIAGVLYYGAGYMQDGERLMILNEAWTTDEHVAELTPIVVEAYTVAYGAPSDVPFIKDWPAAPFHATDEKSRHRADIIKKRIKEYNRITLPFRIRSTMFHKIHTIAFSFTKGQVIPKLAPDAQPIIIEDESEALLFLNETGDYKEVLAGGKNAGLRDLWFEYTNETGDNPKFGILDFDNPANLPSVDHKRVVSAASKILTDMGRQHLIMFSGKNYQIWFAPKVDERFDHISNVRMIAENIGLRVGTIIGAGSSYRNRAIAEQKIWLDLSVFKKKQKIGFFFGLHYKPRTGIEESTGLARVPVMSAELTRFEPLVHAHPEYVLENFDKLKARVDMFCQAVELGDAFPYNDGGYPCYRSPRANPDKEHELTKQLQLWKYKPPMTEISRQHAGVEILMSENLVLTPKLDGWLGLLSYNRMGGFTVNGTKLDSTQVREGRGRRQETERQTVVMCTKGGEFSWDNYLTHEFERVCRNLGLAQCTVVGEIVVYNTEGKIAGPGAVGSVLNRQLGEVPVHDSREFRRLKFIITDVLTMDNSPVDREIPINHRLDLLSGTETGRISIVDYVIITDDTQELFDAYWKRQVIDKGHEGLVAYANDRRYKIKRKFTIDVAVIGIDITSKAWRDQKEVLSTVIVAVSKVTKKGPVFIAFQKVGNFKMTDIERADLFHKVLGEQTGEWGEFANVLPSVSFEKAPGIIWLDPKVVLEVEYNNLGPDTKGAVGLVKFQAKRPSIGDPKLKARGYTVDPAGAFTSRKLVGPPRALRERTDKSVDNPQDISHTQADGAGGLSISKKKTRTILGESLENPESITVTRVRTNPFYGYAAGPRYVAGGGISDGHGTYRAGHPAVRSDTRLSTQRELSGENWQGQGEWKPHYQANIWNEKRQWNGINYYPDLTGLPLGMSDAIYDERGPLISKKGEKGELTTPKLRATLTAEYHTSATQNNVDRDSHFITAMDTNDNKERSDFHAQKMSQKPFTLGPFESKKLIRPLPDVLNNPASSNTRWNARVEAYRTLYREWNKKPAPKSSWETTLLKEFSAWEMELLEKGRNFVDAEEKYSYTEAEEAIIHGHLPAPEGSEPHIFADISLGGDEHDEDDSDSDAA